MSTQTVTTAVARREAGIVKVMWGRKTHFAAVLPEHVDVRSFLGTAAAALYASDDLMKAATASPDSLIAALMRCAALGHQPGTDEFYLTPRKGKILGIEGYRGIVERMYRSGAVASVVVREVCRGDEFDYVEGVHDKPVHKVDWFGAGRGDMIGVYAYAILTTGAVSRVVILSRDDVMAAKAASDAGDTSYSPWNRLDGGQDHPEFTGRSMWWKTAARRLEPWVPTSAEYRREQLRAASAAHEAAAMRPVAPAEGMAQEIHDAEIVREPADAQPAKPRGRGRKAGGGNGTGAYLLQDIARHFDRLGITDEEERLVWIGQLAGYHGIPTSAADLTDEQQAAVLDGLSQCGDIGQLDALTRTGEVPEGSDA